MQVKQSRCSSVKVNCLPPAPDLHRCSFPSFLFAVLLNSKHLFFAPTKQLRETVNCVSTGMTLLDVENFGTGYPTLSDSFTFISAKGLIQGRTQCTEEDLVLLS